MKVWLVVRVGVYDQGVEFVADAAEIAQTFVDNYDPDADGYHSWEIREMTVNAMPEVGERPPEAERWRWYNTVCRKEKKPQPDEDWSGARDVGF